MAAEVKIRGSDQAEIPGTHFIIIIILMAEGVTGLGHGLNTENVTGDFTTMQVTTARVPKTKGHRVWIHSNAAPPREMQRPLDAGRSGARRYGTCLLARGDSACTALPMDASVGAMRTAAVTIAFGMTRIWTSHPQW